MHEVVEIYVFGSQAQGNNYLILLLISKYYPIMLPERWSLPSKRWLSWTVCLRFIPMILICSLFAAIFTRTKENQTVAA